MVPGNLVGTITSDDTLAQAEAKNQVFSIDEEE
jgi:hypothetical protein